MTRFKLSAPYADTTELPDPSLDVAVIVPVYKGEVFIDRLVSRLEDTLARISENYQIILVDDRFPDSSWELIQAHSKRDQRVVGIKLSRNFGQHSAISAGIASADAAWYVVMDCDLQDPPEAILTLYEAAVARNSDVVLAERTTSGPSAGRNIGSALFNSVLSWSSGLKLSSKYGNFRIFSNKVAAAYRHYPERLRLFPAILSQVGFSSTSVSITRDQRPEGGSSYNFLKLAKLSLETIIAYSERPLWVTAFVGSIVCGISFLYGLWVFLSALIFGSQVPGFTTLAILILFFGGLQVFLTSLVGLYVGRNLDEAKSRPIYIIEATTKRDLD